MYPRVNISIKLKLFWKEHSFLTNIMLSSVVMNLIMTYGNNCQRMLTLYQEAFDMPLIT
jgi:hypothetical protein